jgi:hypothetical protein
MGGWNPEDRLNTFVGSASFAERDNDPQFGKKTEAGGRGSGQAGSNQLSNVALEKGARQKLVSVRLTVISF